ncbi:MAG: DUF1549 and DUF1553 domain-containing protein, partial [Gemmataceae bacterium]|nr:DUF1549 and DUF1553 domain-containing protein [Gemmataceae bacterium]
LLTRYGCNQGACHGKGAGQNGFRLSLRGYAPEQDHASLVREFHGRRLSLADPASSPLLRKAAGLAPHEGGKLFNVGSKPYETLLKWIEAGAPGPKKDEPTLKALKLVPSKLDLAPGKSQPLKALAAFSDGSERDVTWLAKFDSGDAGQAEADATGLLKVRRHGESAVRAMFQAEVAVAVVTAPFDAKPDARLYGKRNNAIDDHVMAKLKQLRIEPSGDCSDAEFLRRATLDTLGVLPTPEEVRSFLADKDAQKRAKLVDRLLERPEYADHWALFLGDLFQNRKERDHDVRGAKGVRAFHSWIRKQVAANRPWDALARDVLLASGKADDSPQVGYYVVVVGEHGDPVRSEVADSVAQAFLGTRIGCARCHNHPLEKYTQDDFYHFAAFFSRVKLDRKEPKSGITALKLREGKDKAAAHQPRTNKMLPPRPLDRSAVPEAKPGDDPRPALADWITNPRNEQFSGAMVNRVWKHFLGVGLVEPVDDLRASNPPTNPELWAMLNRQFVAGKYDLKKLMRLILLSRTYQLSSATKPGNVADAKFFSRYYARRLPAEAMLDALSAATGVPDSFPGYAKGMRAGQIPDPGLASRFLSMFGRSQRVTACACERSGEVTLPQLLHLQNGDEVQRKIRDGEGRLGTMLKGKKADDEIIRELFLSTLSRLPDEKQVAAVKKDLADDPTGREAVFQDLFWALLNSKEFLFNY